MLTTMSYFLYFDAFLQNKMYCIFCPDNGNVSFFFSSGREFFLVFKYVYVYMFSLKIANLSSTNGGLVFSVPLPFF